MPAPLPLPTINAHRLVSIVSSPALRFAGRNAVSVKLKFGGGCVGLVWNLVAQARMPGARLFVAKGWAALQTVPLKGPALVPAIPPVPPGMVASSLTTMPRVG